MPLSSLRHTSLIDYANVAAMTAMGKQTFCDEPTALNSNLFPVYANGLVLFLSVSYCKRSNGRFGSSFFKFPFARTNV